MDRGKRKKEYLYNEDVNITKYAKRKLINSITETVPESSSNEVPSDDPTIIKAQQNRTNTFPAEGFSHGSSMLHGSKIEIQSNNLLNESTEIIQNGKLVFAADGLSHESNMHQGSNEAVQSNTSDITDVLQYRTIPFATEFLHFPDNQHEQIIDDEIQNLYRELGTLPIIRECFSSPQINHWDSDDASIILEKISEKTSNVEEMQKKFLEPTSISIEKSPGELFLMALIHSVRFKLSFSALINHLQIINLICEKKIIPETRYIVDKLCNATENITYHSICTDCSQYLGTFDSKVKSVHCSNCSADVDVSSLSKPSFFAIIDPTDAIRDCLQKHQKYYEHIMMERTHDKNNLKDIYYGKCYRSFVKKLSSNDRSNYATLILNADGAPVFKSSKYSIWPFYIMLNEIPIQDRLNNAIVIGMWYSKKKPPMNIVLDSIIKNSINKLSNTGVQCKINGNDICVKLFLNVVCVDTIAQAPMNGTCQFNANYGCDWCEHTGKYYAGSMRYPYLSTPLKRRTKESMITYAEKSSIISKPYRGVNNASPLLKLEYFDVIKGFCPDYMHCMLAGVGNQFTEYYIREMSQNDIKDLDNLLTRLKVPNQLGRLSRGITERRYWKCKEWENWVLYYSLPLLNIFLKNTKMLKHWSLFVTALHICLQTNISYEDLNYLQDILNLFVLEVENLYGLKAMTYNVHQLLHISESIANWGPLWAHSAFAFESANYKLLRSIYCGKGVILQVLRFIKIQRFIGELAKKVYPDCTEDVIEHFDSIVLDKSTNVFRSNLIIYFGNEFTVDKYYMQNFNVPKSTKVFSKIVYKHCLFRTSEKINERSCNCYAQLHDKRFIKIIDFLIDTDTNIEITICQIIQTKENRHAKVIKEICNISNTMIAVSTTDIDKVCVLIECNEQIYIIPVVNLLKY